MAKFVMMHCGFEKPTEEIMGKWGAWFKSMEPHTVENIGFAGGQEISDAGTTELGWDADAITGLSIVEADDMDAAMKLAESNPFVKSIRIYAVREHG